MKLHGLTSFFNQAFSFNASTTLGSNFAPYFPIISMHFQILEFGQLTHSVASHPGNTAFTLTFGLKAVEVSLLLSKHPQHLYLKTEIRQFADIRRYNMTPTPEY